MSQFNDDNRESQQSYLGTGRTSSSKSDKKDDIKNKQDNSFTYDLFGNKIESQQSYLGKS